MIYTLLVVSENPDHYNKIKRYLKSSNNSGSFTIVHTLSVETTLDYLSQNSVSMVIVDSETVNRNDKDLVKKIKVQPLFLDKPILLMISSFDNLVEGFDPFSIIHLPLNKEELILKVNSFLNRYYEQNRLIEEMFNQSKEHKKEISLLKDRMLLIFAHELKTPLNAIINFSGYINRGLKKKLTKAKVDKFTELSELIEVNGKVLLEEINTLLDIVKLKEDRMVFNMEDIDISELINSTLGKYKLLYNKKLETNIDHLTIYSDIRSFIHIFENLYSNALKYASSMVLVTLKEDKGDFILTVEDDGRGIKDDQKNRIFELFEQTEQTVLNREKEGTGIGLYIVKLLCEHFKYGISVEDSNLGGAKFIIRGKIK